MVFVFDARSGIGVVNEGGEVGVVCVAVEEGEDAEAERAEDEDEEKDEEREVLEGSGAVIVGDLEVLGRVGFAAVVVVWRRQRRRRRRRRTIVERRWLGEEGLLGRRRSVV